MENLITKTVRTIIVITLLTGILATIGCGHQGPPGMSPQGVANYAALGWTWDGAQWVKGEPTSYQPVTQTEPTSYQVRRFVGTMLQGLSIDPPYTRPSSRDIRELSDETAKLRQELERRRLGY